jgi:DNA-binding beta-propeller fold protein YncE
MMRLALLPLLALPLLLAAVTGEAQLALSANDNKVVLVDGVSTVVQNPPVDTVSVIDLKQYPPRLVAEITAPTSVVGPPLSVAITPDESLALVTAAMKIDPSDPKKQIPDNRVSVIDLKASPPQVIATLEAGKGPAGLSINRQGNLALLANRAEGTVSVFTISGKTVTPAGSVKLGDDKIGASHVAISPDGKTALVSRDGDDRISVLSIDGTKVEYAKRDLNAGLRPYGLDISSDGKYAAVANIGRGGGDADTVSLIDMTARPARVVDTITVGQTPEGLKISPDSKWIGVVVMNGSNKPKSSPFFTDWGKLVILRPDGAKLVKVAEARIGHWSQGVAFSADGRTILVGNMVEKNLQVFDWNGSALKDSGHSIKLNGGSAAVRVADKP